MSVAALNILLDRMTRVRLASDPPDVTINSDIGKIALLEFDRADEAIAIGRRRHRTCSARDRGAGCAHQALLAEESHERAFGEM